MSKWINSTITDPVFSAMDDAFDAISLADGLAVCTAQPTSYFQAINPDAWSAEAAYLLDDAVRPTVTRNGFTYVCTTAGTSGTSEPVWPVTVGDTVTDGTVVWTCFACLCVGNVSLTGSDFVKVDSELTVMPKTGITAHSAGSMTHVVLIRSGTKALILTSTCTAQAVAAGNIINTAAFTVSLAGPV